MNSLMIFKTRFGEPVLRFFHIEKALFTSMLFKIVLLLGGTAIGIYIAVENRNDSQVASASYSSVQSAPRQIEHKMVQSHQYENFYQHHNDGRFCRAEVQVLARKHFASNDQLKYSVAVHLAKTYKITPKYADEIVRTTAKVSKDHDVDPFLMLGIIGKESSFNQTARSGYGATGLMQVHAPSHKALLKMMGLNVNNVKLTEKSLQSEMRVNVAAGIQIYKQYENQFESRIKALQAYNGAKKDTTLKYSKSVLALRDAFSYQAAALIGCDKEGYAFINTSKEKLELITASL